MILKVIYIDDEAEICELFADLFGNEEIEIETFTDPERALDRIHAVNPDLVVVDYRLPGTTGDLIAARISIPIPIACVSGDYNMVSGFDFFQVLKKPFDIEKITKLFKEIQG